MIVSLLSSVMDLSRLEAFLQTEQRVRTWFTPSPYLAGSWVQVEMEDVRGLLLRHQQFVSLALLCWRKHCFEEALGILRDLSFRKCLEVKSKNGSVRSANGKQERVAVFYTSCILVRILNVLQSAKPLHVPYRSIQAWRQDSLKNISDGWSTSLLHDFYTCAK